MSRLFTHAHFIDDPVFEETERPKRVKQINQYQLLEIIGYGATSKVFFAMDAQSESPFVAKVISINGANNEGLALEREIRLLRSLDHPNIIKLREVLHNKKRQTAYVIIEWASFGSLQSHIGKDLPLPAISSIFLQVLQGLKYLHGRGIVHHDIKPSNILLFRDGVAKLSDFGIGHSFDSADTMIGTPAYQAPEFFNDTGEDLLDPVKQDIWSLGISLYEAVFGRLPYTGENMYQISFNMRNKPLEFPNSAPKDVCDLISKMLDLNPESRLGLEDVMEHPFLRDAAENFSLDIAVPDLPRLTSSKSLLNIPAVVCQEGYTFAHTKRSFSWSGIDDPED
jgi:serine/threonine-protein kinase 11